MPIYAVKCCICTCIYGSTGETFDARFDIDGWSSVPALSDLRGGATAWAPVSVMTPAGTGFGPLLPTNVPPLRACEVLSPVSAWSVPRLGYGNWNASRAWIFDFGKNSAGMTTLRFSAAEVGCSHASITKHTPLVYSVRICIENMTIVQQAPQIVAAGTHTHTDVHMHGHRSAYSSRQE